MLANFGADVGIVGMESREGIVESIDISEVEGRFVEGADCVEYIKGPSASFGSERGERLEFVEGAARFDGGDWSIVFDEKDSGIGRNSV